MQNSENFTTDKPINQFKKCIEIVLSKINNVHLSPNFGVLLKVKISRSYLDLIVVIENSKLTLNIYRKLTVTGAVLKWIRVVTI
jgi:hypothetical protein